MYNLIWHFYLQRLHLISYKYEIKESDFKVHLFITDNIASEGVVSQDPSGSQPASQANDGDITTCSKTKGSSITFQVDLQEISIVTGLFILLGGMLLTIQLSNR